jgi:hypothetical protein
MCLEFLPYERTVKVFWVIIVDINVVCSGGRAGMKQNELLPRSASRLMRRNHQLASIRLNAQFKGVQPNRRVHCGRSQVIRQNACPGYVGTAHEKAFTSSFRRTREVTL